MRVFLAGTMDGNQGHFLLNHQKNILTDVSILESFFYADEATEKALPLMSDFLLDSGAFSFMTSAKGQKVDWVQYINRYAAFVKRNNIQKFIELDIDSLVGYPKVLEYRDYLESKVGRKCIPVWHRSRGIEDFKRTCDEYPYIAIGGLVTKEIKSTEYEIFDFLIKEAHARETKIHGLGLTNLEAIKRYKFDSVDSSSWTCGNRFGFIWQFTGNGFKKHSKPKGCRIKDPRKIAERNFNEWVKFQRYAEKKL